MPDIAEQAEAIGNPAQDDDDDPGGAEHRRHRRDIHAEQVDLGKAHGRAPCIKNPPCWVSASEIARMLARALRDASPGCSTAITPTRRSSTAKRSIASFGLPRDKRGQGRIQLVLQAKARCGAAQPDDLLAHGQGRQQLRALHRFGQIRQHVQAMENAPLPPPRAGRRPHRQPAQIAQGERQQPAHPHRRRHRRHKPARHRGDDRAADNADDIVEKNRGIVRHAVGDAEQGQRRQDHAGEQRRVAQPRHAPAGRHQKQRQNQAEAAKSRHIRQHQKIGGAGVKGCQDRADGKSVGGGAHLVPPRRKQQHRDRPEDHRLRATGPGVEPP